MVACAGEVSLSIFGSVNLLNCARRPLKWEQPRTHSLATLPNFSIITPTLNRSAFIGHAIQSVREQRYPNIEHIVVDGGSTDDTLAMLKNFEGLVVLEGPDRGSHQAMNRGISKAAGEIVGFLNSDDVYAPGVLFEVARRFCETRCDAVVTNSVLFEVEGDLKTVISEIRHAQDVRNFFLETLYGTPGFNGMFFRRSCVLALNGFDSEFDIAADREFLLRLVIGGHALCTIPTVGYGYLKHDGSRTLDASSRLGDKILLEHMSVAAKLMTESGEFKSALRRWSAFETLHLIIRQMASGRWIDAWRIIRQAFGADWFWAFRLVGAIRDRHQCTLPSPHAAA